MIQCPDCSKEVAEDWKFCLSCGAERPHVETLVEEPQEDIKHPLPGGDGVQWTLGASFAVFILSTLATAVFFIPLSEIEGRGGDSQNWVTAIGLIFSEIAMVTTVYLWIKLRHNQGWRALGFSMPTRKQLLAGVGWGGVGVFASAVVASIVNLIVELNTGSPPAPPDQIPVVGDPATMIVVLLGISTIILAPFAEEMFFRGMVHQAARRRMAFVGGTLVSSVIFSAVHIIPLVLPSIFVLAIILAFIYERHKTIWVPMVAHMTFNIVGFWATFLA